MLVMIRTQTGTTMFVSDEIQPDRSIIQLRLEKDDSESLRCGLDRKDDGGRAVLRQSRKFTFNHFDRNGTTGITMSRICLLRRRTSHRLVTKIMQEVCTRMYLLRLLFVVLKTSSQVGLRIDDHFLSNNRTLLYVFVQLFMHITLILPRRVLMLKTSRN